jgi:prepilin-type N-terminal cleavage/methylation domain-containing protein
MGARARGGFTLLELIIVVSIIALISAIALPRLQTARMTANETSAVVTLRAVAQAQAQMLTAPQIDSDADGRAEYGYFGELSGQVPPRVSGGGIPAAGPPGSELAPSPLLSTLGNVQQGVVVHSGYCFQVWLPGASAGGVVPGVPEDPAGGKLAGPFPDPDSGEILWAAYAWPLKANHSGTAAFFVNQEGQILRTHNRDNAYGGMAGGPPFDAALSGAGDMDSDLGIHGLPSVDGKTWFVVQ